jgi:hypothetical protein
VKKQVWVAFLFLSFLSCHSSRKISRSENTETIHSLRWLGKYELPHNLAYKGTTVGGLSGIDYDKERNCYYLISDDRSALQPARFYTARIYFHEGGLDSVTLINVTTLLQPSGSPYSNSLQDPAHTPDPEAIRYNPVLNRMVWSSEGERIVKPGKTVLENPAITEITPDGKYIDSFPLPVNLHMQAVEKGPRQNGVLEGLSFADNYTKLYVNVEEPLYEDGPRADTTPNNAWIRIYQYAVSGKKNTAQYAYHLDPVASPAIPGGAFKINGVPDILAYGNRQLIVMERSFSTGRLPCTIKLFLTDLRNASDISDIASLRENPPAKPATKKLLLNLDSLGTYVDNLEGMTFGPDLPNGHKTLILVADNNFSAFEKTQFFLFEVIP